MKLQPLLFIFLCCTSLFCAAQDSLPRFTLVNKGNNRIIISWTNPYGDGIRQLSIQRSTDSTKNFKSILTLPDPTVPQNGYADTKAPSSSMYYRLFILLDSGKYIFSKSRRPVLDTMQIREPLTENHAPNARVAELPKTDAPRSDMPVSHPPSADNKNPARTEPAKPKEIPERIFFVKKRDTLVGQVGERSLKRFRDSILLRTRDTLTYNNTDTILIRPFVPKEIYKPSRYIFTERDGNVKITLPDAAQKKYSIRFFEDGGAPLFEIKRIEESPLTLDKANFLHAGWFRFELYDDGILKEKHKLYIAKEF